jgi:N-methylhydantoinase B
MDPAARSILANRLNTIAGEMISTLLRTARSGVLNTARDLSCAILTADNRLLVFAESLPIHVASLGLECAMMTTTHAGQLRPGDAYLSNSPYDGGTHHADHTILVPIFDGARHVFTVCAKAHQADVGNSRPTTYSATPRDIYEEGALNFPCVKVQSEFQDVADIIRICTRRIRVPDQWYGDYLSAIGAARIGERAIHELLANVGATTLDEFVEDWLTYGENRMIDEIRDLPNGRWHGSGRHDPFPGVPDGIELRASIDVQTDAGVIEVDLRDNEDCVPCGLNLSEATARAAVIIGIFNSLAPDVPLNDGSLKRIRIHLRENCVVGIPRFPVSCSVATTNVADRMVNLITSLMAAVRPDYSEAEGGLGIPASRAVISGRDSRRGGESFVNQIFLGTAGGGASSDCDGWVCFITPVNGGVSFIDSVEIDEQKYPFIVYRRELVPDSGGPGRFRGAPGWAVEYGPSGDDQLVVVYASDGHVAGARGVNGGLSGQTARMTKIDAHGNAADLPAVAEVVLNPGERIRAVSCGGGGFGDPRERAPDRIEKDLREGYISPDQAQRV